MSSQPSTSPRRGAPPPLPGAPDEQRARLLRPAPTLRELALDLREGPLQEMLELEEDLQLFRSQLARELADGEERDETLARIDELTRHLERCSRELGDLVGTLGSRGAEDVPLTVALAREVEQFQSAAGIPVELELAGRVDELTPECRTVLLRVVHEALANVRSHSRAGWAKVSITEEFGEVWARVTDNGLGFEPADALDEATRRGRLGLVGMSERMRLVAGQLEIDSQPGGPTRISARFPAA
jgi:signal transduction histidine kinase